MLEQEALLIQITHNATQTASTKSTIAHVKSSRISPTHSLFSPISVLPHRSLLLQYPPLPTAPSISTRFFLLRSALFRTARSSS
ncbi:unnamed protein product [Sphenostylis stenocarpa]|uniref:Uncharacterized protein n=1 Tax=Sphenostylis stenocarpa TaxID=92480 RepID=A0AA86RYC2_9FABA|nr:unnamed protein product [Sphenostylis stenocarpa]